MNCSFVCKLLDDAGEFLGTAFLIKNNVLYTANHNFKFVEDTTKCYIELKSQLGIKRTFKVSNVIEELDLAELTLDDILNISYIPKISTECIIEDKIFSYGYKEDDVTSEIIDTTVKLDKYDELTGEISDNSYMIKDEEDCAKWSGFSGAPVYTNENICGMVIRNIGGDGIKTRLKIISFNKILNFLVKHNKREMIENFPQKFISSGLSKRINKNKELCQKLYYNSCFQFDNTNIDFRIDFLKVQDDNELNVGVYVKEIQKLIEDYSLSLDFRYKAAEEIIFNDEYIRKMYKRIEEVKKRMQCNFNSAYIILWMLSEGILNSPKIGKVLVEEDSLYSEKDIFFKKDKETIKLLIPFISVYEDLNECLENIINAIKNNDSLPDISEVDWDLKAIECLDYISQVNIGDIIRQEYTKEVELDITALVIYKSEIYENIPNLINSEDRRVKYFSTEFEKRFKSDSNKYNNMIELSSSINHINVHLFVIPISDINVIEKI